MFFGSDDGSAVLEMVRCEELVWHVRVHVQQRVTDDEQDSFKLSLCVAAACNCRHGWLLLLLVLRKRRRRRFMRDKRRCLLARRWRFSLSICCSINDVANVRCSCHGFRLHLSSLHAIHSSCLLHCGILFGQRCFIFRLLVASLVTSFHHLQ